MEETMGKTIDTSELLYRMGKYAEIDVGKEGHDAFMHFMLLLTRTIEKMPNAALTHKNPIDDEIMENQYKLADAISLVTGRTRNDGWYPTWIGMTMKIVRLKSGESVGFRYIKDNEGHDYPGAMHTSHVTDYYISDDKKNLIIQTENTVYKFEKVEED
jgi:hypothetical protein